MLPAWSSIVFYSSPWMVVIVGTMLILCRIGCRLPAAALEGECSLVVLYLVYLVMTSVAFYLKPAGNSATGRALPAGETP